MVASVPVLFRTIPGLRGALPAVARRRRRCRSSCTTSSQDETATSPPELVADLAAENRTSSASKNLSTTISHTRRSLLPFVKGDHRSACCPDSAITTPSTESSRRGCCAGLTNVEPETFVQPASRPAVQWRCTAIKSAERISYPSAPVRHCRPVHQRHQGARSEQKGLPIDVHP